MKKRITILMMIAMAAILTGCGNSSGSKSADNNSGNAVQNVLDQQMKDAEESETETTAPVEETEKTEADVAESEVKNAEKEDTENDSEYDLDLTTASSTIVFSEVQNMMYAPDKFLGKKVRMGGKFTVYQAVDTDGEPIPDKHYFACVIADAAACCAQGLEFVLAGDYVYPDDYPEPGEYIVVSGTFDIYEENGYTYSTLVDAVFE